LVDVEIGQDRVPVDGNVENPVPGRGPIGLHELEGHLIGTRRDVENIREGIAVPLALVKGLVPRPRQGSGDGAGGDRRRPARIVLIRAPNISLAVGILGPARVHPPSGGNHRGGGGRQGSGRLLVNPDIVHQHGLGKGGAGVRRTRPAAPDRHVQQEKEGTVEFVGAARARAPGGGLGLIKDAVHVKLNLVLLPKKPEGVVGVVVKRPPGQGIGPGRVPIGGVKGAVVDRLVRRVADILHDVHLAAGGPSDRADVVPQHPKGRPNAVAVGHLDAGFHVAVLETLEAGSQKPGGGIAPHCAVIGVAGLGIDGDEGQGLPVGGVGVRDDLGVVRAGRVVLEFVIAPAAVARVVGPVGAIRGASHRPVELVAPNQVVSGGRHGPNWGGYI